MINQIVSVPKEVCLYDLKNGDTFLWRGDIYVVVLDNNECYNQYHVRKLGTVGFGDKILFCSDVNEIQHLNIYTPVLQIQLQVEISI